MINEELENNAVKAISRYYHKSKIKRKVIELLEKRKMQNNQGGGKNYNKYYQFFIEGNDVYHRTIWQSVWSNDSVFSLTNKKLKVEWSKN